MTLRFVDSHCHLQVDRLSHDVPALLARAREAGVDSVLIAGIDPKASRAALEIARTHGQWASAGTHPCHAGDHDQASIAALLDDPRVVAVGECGLDFFHKPFDAAEQERVLRAQIELAQSHDLPLIVHSRDADRETPRVLREAGARRGVFHCFGGDRRCLEEALGLGFFVSFAGNITYPGSALRALVPLVPQERLLVETDSPWLAPAPDRGKTNEPMRVVRVLEEVAVLRGEPPEETAEAVVRNFAACFPRTAGPGVPA